ncbi:MAG: HlyD family efflux transporter periplasmic adaptor subunit [Gammaproteobacteria bacterium]|nr:HlyD family efflux transporter periplasmic adaptor subunit [Gammaproteobacteria bacterium]
MNYEVRFRSSNYLAGLSIIACLQLAACDTSLNEIAVLGTLERDRIELSADSSEPIRAILVREGQKVAIGESLVLQGTERAEAALARARANEQAAKAALAEAEKGPRAQAIEQGRARLQAAKSSQTTALHELERQKSLVTRNFSAQNTVDILQGRFDESVARREEARAALDELLAGTRSEVVDQARSRHAAAAAIVADLMITLQRATIKSPVVGMVEVLPFELGERPRPGATVVVVLAENPVYARIHIPEPLRTRITSGTAAQVSVDSYHRTFPARVRWVAADASFTPFFALSERDRTRLSFLAEVDLSDIEDVDLPVGVPVQVTFPGIEP